MTLDWSSFTPGSAALGGVLRPQRGDVAWRVALVAGPLATAAICALATV